MDFIVVGIFDPTISSSDDDSSSDNDSSVSNVEHKDEYPSSDDECDLDLTIHSNDNHGHVMEYSLRDKNNLIDMILWNQKYVPKWQNHIILKKRVMLAIPITIIK